MKNIIIIVCFLALFAAAGGGAYFLMSKLGTSTPETTYEPIGSSTPVTLSGNTLQGKSLPVPDFPTVTATLDLVAATARRDNPMGRFTSPDGTISGTLVAYDDYLTAGNNNRRAVPIAVNKAGAGDFFYLAILEGDDMKYATSLPLGDRISLQSVVQTGDQVTVSYLVHDRGQTMAELPTVATTAIFDIAAGTIVQAGRVPMDEVVIEVKTFAGTYYWKETKGSDGSVVTPGKPDTFTLIFEGGNLSLGTDCNSAGSSYTAGTGSSTDFTITALAKTAMFCESSQEGVYFDAMSKVASYKEANDGALTFTLRDNAGTVTFVPAIKKLEFSADQGSSTADIIKEVEAQ